MAGFVVAFIASIPSIADAQTADDVINKMSQAERIGYLAGMIDMLSYQDAMAGRRERASCIREAYYRSGDEAMAQLLSTLRAFPDRQPEAILTVLVNRRCGE